MTLRDGAITGRARPKRKKRVEKVAKTNRPRIVYHTLTKTPEIRLLEILPSTSARSIVNCRLSIISLEEAPEYVALSYVWGDAAVTRNILVNNRLMPVTANLESALRQIRTSLFYQTASENDRRTNLGWMIKYPDLWDRDCPRGTENQFWNAIDKLYSLDYWSRVWTLQERVLAKRLWFMLGPYVVDGLYFEEVTTLLGNIQAGVVTKPTFVSDKVWGFLCAEGYIRTSSVNFYKAIMTSSGKRSEVFGNFFYTLHYRATDPRDKIYAVLGLFEHLRKEKSLVPDYSISVKSLYCDFGRAYIRSTDNHELLCASGLVHEVLRSYDLPSWVPEWDGISESAVADVKRVSKSTEFRYPVHSFNTCGKLETLVKARSHVGGQNELHIHGSICDSVSEIEPLMRYVSDEFDGFCSTYCSSHGGPSYKTGIPPLQAIFCTLTMEADVKKYSSGGRTNSTQSLIDMIVFILFAVTVRPPKEPILVVKAFMEDSRAFWACHSRDPYPELPSLQTIIDEANQFTTFIPMTAGIIKSVHRYRLFHTKNGLLGLAPRYLLPGDLICAIQRCSFPVVLRREQEHYVHVGPCFVLGLMDGEIDMLIEDGSAFI